MLMKYSQIKAFFFDLDGTLRLPNPSPTDAFIQIAQKLGISISPEVAHQVKLWAYQFWGQDKRVKDEMDRLGPKEFWVYYSGLLLDAVDPAENDLERAIYISTWFQTEYKPDVILEPHCLETLHYLKECGYILGLISNREAALDEVVVQLGLDNIFDMTLAAGEVGIWKPNPTIFWHALSYFPRLSPEMCVYIGDNYFADSVGAQAAGMIPVTFDPDQIYDSIDSFKIQTMAELIPLLEGNLPANW